MIGLLPKELLINGSLFPINTDYRVALIVFQAMEDPTLTKRSKMEILLDAIFCDASKIPRDSLEEAINQASLYLDGGKKYKEKQHSKKVMDWEQDEQMIFSAVNHVAGKEVRTETYLHWWTFLGYFSEIQEGLFSTVLSIRQKKSEGKKLERHEAEFYKKSKELVDLKRVLTEEEKSELEEIKKILNG